MPKADELLAELESGHEKLDEEIPGEVKDFRNFAENVHSEGALSAKQKSLIALGAAAVKQCKYCIVFFFNNLFDFLYLRLNAV